MTEILQALPLEDDPNLLVGRETSDKAGMYRFSEDVAAIRTIDFVSPIVNDPYDFGRIAAAEADRFVDYLKANGFSDAGLYFRFQRGADRTNVTLLMSECT